MFFPAGGESVLRSLPAPADPQPEAARSRQEGGIRGQFENGDRALEPDGQRDVGRAQHGRPTQGNTVVLKFEGIRVWEKRGINAQERKIIIMCLYYSYYSYLVFI